MCRCNIVCRCRGRCGSAGATRAVFASYCPGLPALVVQVEVDVALQRMFDKALPAFIKELDEMRQRLRNKGVEPAADWFANNTAGQQGMVE